MRKRYFLIPSLVAAGFTTDHVLATSFEDKTWSDGDDKTLFDVFRLEHYYDLAAHRSHSSHRSHRSSSGSGHGSHQSHRSSAGGSATPTPKSPSRNYESTPPSSVLPGSPSTAPKKTLPGNSKKFIEVARQVQTGLYAYRYYTGAIDGIVGPQTKSAIARFQRDFGLSVTGTITPEVLNALKITAK